MVNGGSSPVRARRATVTGLSGASLLTVAPVSRWLLVVPLAWPLAGGSAAFMLGVTQQGPPSFSGLPIVPVLRRDRRPAALLAAA